MNYADFKRYRLGRDSELLPFDQLDLLALRRWGDDQPRINSDMHTPNIGHYVKEGAGVMSLLGELFLDPMFTGYQLHLPCDVYPRYFDTVPTDYAVTNFILNSFDRYSLPNDRKVLFLITHPLIPSGRHLTHEEQKIIERWLDESEDRWLIIDSVYDFTGVASGVTWICPRVITLNSLSKISMRPHTYGWASCRLPIPGFKRSTKKRTINILPLSAIFEKAWQFVEAGLLDRELEFSAPETGYLTTLSLDYRVLRDSYGIAAIPVSVFGEGGRGSVLSCLGVLDDYL